MANDGIGDTILVTGGAGFIGSNFIRHAMALRRAWRPRFTFEAAVEMTVDWCLNHQQWVDSVRSGSYRQ